MVLEHIRELGVLVILLVKNIRMVFYLPNLGFGLDIGLCASDRGTILMSRSQCTGLK